MFKVLYCNNDLIRQHIAESLVMSSLPMRAKVTQAGLEEEILQLTDIITYAKEDGLVDYINSLNKEELASDRNSKSLKRGNTLGKVASGTGHDCALKGMVVTAIVNAPAYWWTQFQRYHFADIISSQSKMHRITKMNIEEACVGDVDQVVIDRLNVLIEEYNKSDDVAFKKKAFRNIVASSPQGLTLSAGIVTNYLQLKTMMIQRDKHKLTEWSQDFVHWVENLPYFNYFTGRAQ